jgi:putative hydrolase of HD superfamily
MQNRKEQTGMDGERLKKQIEFIIEIDKLKSIVRQTLLTDSSRQENSAEHSWHLALMAFVLHEHANGEDIDIFRVIKMALIHDLVEIDAGDAYCYDASANEGKEEREREAADRIFGLLPPDQSEELHELWNELEARETPEARFAAALDRLQPLLNNYTTNGKMWLKHKIKRIQVIERNQPIEDGSSTLWEVAAGLIEDAVRRSLLIP